MKSQSRYRWFVFAIFFGFMLLHQADKLLIGPLTTPIMETYQIDEARMGFVFSGAILVGAIFYPLWGYLFDRYARSKLIALASLVWGCTTWISAIAPTFPMFLVSRASTGIDDSSYPGLYSLLADYFGPRMRGKVYGLLQIAMPMGYLVGMVLAMLLGGVIGWRSVFYITGSLGILMSLLIWVGVKDQVRGGSEPELEKVVIRTSYRFDWQIARDLFKKRSLIFLFAQGFFGVFPWQVISFWFFRYLEVERGFTSNEVLITMVVAILFLSAGYPIGGALGDRLFRHNPRGRLLIASFGVITGAILMLITMNIPNENRLLFMILLPLTAVFIPFASANVLSTVYDVTLPEVRATSNSIQHMIEEGGSAVAPALAGLIAASFSLKTAIVLICVSAWFLCFLFFLLTIRYIPADIHTLREQLRQRAEFESSRKWDSPLPQKGEEPLGGLV